MPHKQDSPEYRTSEGLGRAILEGAIAGASTVGLSHEQRAALRNRQAHRNGTGSDASEAQPQEYPVAPNPHGGPIETGLGESPYAVANAERIAANSGARAIQGFQRR